MVLADKESNKRQNSLGNNPRDFESMHFLPKIKEPTSWCLHQTQQSCTTTRAAEWAKEFYSKRHSWMFFFLLEKLYNHKGNAYKEGLFAEPKRSWRQVAERCSRLNLPPVEVGFSLVSSPWLVCPTMWWWHSSDDAVWIQLHTTAGTWFESSLEADKKRNLASSAL